MVPTGDNPIPEEATFIRASGGRQLEVLLTLLPPNLSSDGIDAHALIDSGCTGSCIDSRFVSRYQLITKPYINPLKVHNADGSDNEGGLITEYVELEMAIGGHQESIRLAVTTLASSNIFLGHDWLIRHNPEIDWKLGTMEFTRCPDTCQLDEIQVRNVQETMNSERKWPEYLDEFADVFSEKGFEQLPEHREWDHGIDLKPEFRPSDCKIYPLNPQENSEHKAFIRDNMASGRIRYSKSPMASPAFFIKKEDGSLRFIQDYQKLNEGTIKKQVSSTTDQ